jgi:hypothetical protein
LRHNLTMCANQDLAQAKASVARSVMTLIRTCAGELGLCTTISTFYPKMFKNVSD